MNRKHRWRYLKKGTTFLMIGIMGINGVFFLKADAAKKKVAPGVKSLTLAVGEKQTLSIKNKRKKYKYSFTSKNKKIATVTIKGQVHAKKAGTTKILVKEKNGKKKSITIGTVTVKVLNKASLEKTKIALVRGKTATIAIKNKWKGASYSFKSSKPAVAGVNGKGIVTAKEAGTAKITVKEVRNKKGAKTVGTVQVTVTDPNSSETPGNDTGKDPEKDPGNNTEKDPEKDPGDNTEKDPEKDPGDNTEKDPENNTETAIQYLEITPDMKISACGWNGADSVSSVVKNVTIGKESKTVIEVTNNNCNSAPVFTFSLGNHKLSDFEGIQCKVMPVSGNFTYKVVSAEIAGVNQSSIGAIASNNSSNLKIAELSFGSLGKKDQVREMKMMLNKKEIKKNDPDGNVQIALGVATEPQGKYYIYDIALVLKEETQKKWTDVPSIKEVVNGRFENFGMEVNRNDLNREDILEGIVYHCSSVTMENEMKPDALLGRIKRVREVTEKDREGMINEYQESVVPDLDFTQVDQILQIAKDSGLKVRGHCLVWHSQTPKWFFCEDYDVEKGLVSKEVMDARMEYYIKTVLTHIQDWEKKNNGGKTLVYVWDVVNEVCSDSNGYRGQNEGEESNWYQIYQSTEFAVNAFVYANRYAGEKVELYYNDYNCYFPSKTEAIVNLVKEIQKNADARIDGIGLQSHVLMQFPSVEGYENAVKEFEKLNVGIQVTELDIHNTDNTKEGLERQKQLYRQYFEMFLRHTDTIRGVTIWGSNDAYTWLNGVYQEESFPLLFDHFYFAKPAYFGVMEALQK